MVSKCQVHTSSQVHECIPHAKIFIYVRVQQMEDTGNAQVNRMTIALRCQILLTIAMSNLASGFHHTNNWWYANTTQNAISGVKKCTYPIATSPIHPYTLLMGGSTSKTHNFKQLIYMRKKCLKSSGKQYLNKCSHQRERKTERENKL